MSHVQIRKYANHLQCIKVSCMLIAKNQYNYYYQIALIAEVWIKAFPNVCMYVHLKIGTP